MKSQVHVSAGGLIVTSEGKIVLTSRRNFSGELQWGLPKGIVEEAESLEDAAVRETLEETGLKVVALSKLPTVEYWYVQPPRAHTQEHGPDSGAEPIRIHKFVHYFLMQMTGGDPAAHDHETEEVAFLDPAEAVKRASYSSEKKLLRSVIDDAVTGGTTSAPFSS